MTTSNREPSSTPPTLTDELLAEVAYLRAQGHSWDDTAKAIGWDAAKLRGAIRFDPRFEVELAVARLEAEREAEDALLARLRQLAASDDPKQALQAVTLMTRHLAARRRGEVRIAVEQLRAQARPARTEGEKGKSNPPEPGTVVYLSAGDRRVADAPQVVLAKDARVDARPVATAADHKREARTPEPPKPRVAPEG